MFPVLPLLPSKTSVLLAAVLCLQLTWTVIAVVHRTWKRRWAILTQSITVLLVLSALSDLPVLLYHGRVASWQSLNSQELPWVLVSSVVVTVGAWLVVWSRASSSGSDAGTTPLPTPTTTTSPSTLTISVADLTDIVRQIIGTSVASQQVTTSSTPPTNSSSTTDSVVATLQGLTTALAQVPSTAFVIDQFQRLEDQLRRPLLTTQAVVSTTSIEEPAIVATTGAENVAPTPRAKPKPKPRQQAQRQTSEVTAEQMVGEIIEKDPDVLHRLGSPTVRHNIIRHLLHDDNVFSRVVADDKLTQAVSQRRKDNRERAKFLSEEEKAMTLDALHRKFKLEDQQRRNEREELRRHDYEELGDLTEAEKELPKHEIRKIISRRREQCWRQRMIDSGRKLHQCQVCRKYILDDAQHTCFDTGTRLEDKGKSRPYQHRQLVVQKTGGNAVSLKPVTIVDPQAVETEFQRLEQLRQEYQDGLKALQTNLAVTTESTTSETATPGPPPSGSTSAEVHPSRL